MQLSVVCQSGLQTHIHTFSRGLVWDVTAPCWDGFHPVPAPLATGLVAQDAAELIQPACLLAPSSPSTPAQGSVPAQSPAVIAVQTLQQIAKAQGACEPCRTP